MTNQETSEHLLKWCAEGLDRLNPRRQNQNGVTKNERPNGG